MFTYLFGWLVFSIIVGVFAHQRRNRSGGGWFVLALIISPLLAFLIVACLQARKSQQTLPIRDSRWNAMRSTPMQQSQPKPKVPAFW